jgi:hypothetical protein
VVSSQTQIAPATPILPEPVAPRPPVAEVQVSYWNNTLAYEYEEYSMMSNDLDFLFEYSGSFPAFLPKQQRRPVFEHVPHTARLPYLVDFSCITTVEEYTEIIPPFSF